MGDNSDKTNTDELFFMRNLKTLAYLFIYFFWTDGCPHARTDEPKAICPPQLFPSLGHKHSIL